MGGEHNHLIDDIDGLIALIDERIRLAAAPPPPVEPCQRLMVPLYPTTAALVDQAVAPVAPAGSVLIANFGPRQGSDVTTRGGPGQNPDPAATAAFGRARQRGWRVLGYVPTAREAITLNTSVKRTDANIFADVDAWYSFYDIDGIFFDELNAEGEIKTRAWADYVGGELCVGNPGWWTYAQFNTAAASAFDVLMTYEGDPGGFTASNVADKQEQDAIPGLDYAAIVGSCLSSLVADVVERSRGFNVGYIYCCDFAPGAGYARLPPYWTALVAAVADCAGG